MKSAFLVLLACASYVSAQTIAAASQNAGVLGNLASMQPDISDDGRYVAFESLSNNLGSNMVDGNGVADIFVHDVSTGVTTLESVGTTTNGVSAAGDAASNFAQISGDGNCVVFTSAASTFFMGTNGLIQVYLRDRDDETTELISRTTGSTGAIGNGASSLPAVSGDGEIIAFTTQAANLGGSAMTSQVVVRDRDDDTTTIISRASGAAGAVGTGVSAGSAVSADGRFVAFTSLATNLIPAGQGQNTANGADVFIRDLDDDSTSIVSVAAPGGLNNNAAGSGFASLGMSYDGRYVAFTSNSPLVANDNNGFNDIYVRDLEDGITTLVSVATGGVVATGGASTNPTMSGDGRYVAFQSSATNLVGAVDTNAADDVFLHDRETGITTRVSTDMNGVQGMGQAAAAFAAGRPQISHDGSLVVFDSDYTNLVAGDMNGQRDVFIAIGDSSVGSYFGAGVLP